MCSIDYGMRLKKMNLKFELGCTKASSRKKTTLDSDTVGNSFCWRFTKIVFVSTGVFLWSQPGYAQNENGCDPVRLSKPYWVGNTVSLSGTWGIGTGGSVDGAIQNWIDLYPKIDQCDGIIVPASVTPSMQATTPAIVGSVGGIGGSIPTWKIGDVIFTITSSCHSSERTEPAFWSQCSATPTPVKDRYKKPPNTCPAYGRPISPLTGSKRQSEILGQWLGLSVQVVYDTRSKAPSNDASLTFSSQSTPSFGALWESSLHKRLVLQSTGRLAIQAARGANSWVSFIDDGTGHLAADADITDTLVAISGGWLYTDASAQSRETYDSTGVLKNIAYANGTVLTYIYSDTSTPATVAPIAGLLIKIQDQFGHNIQFQYEQAANANLPPRIAHIIDPAAKTLDFGYDTANNLQTITWADRNVRKFFYEKTNLPWALTGIEDENRARLTTYDYDDAGRAVETQAAGGVDHFKTTYGTPPRMQITETYDAQAGVIWRDHIWVAPENTVVTLSNGQTTTLNASVVQGVPRLTSSNQPGGSGCGASTSAQGYDDKGNVTLFDDFNGNRSCFAYDTSRNLRTVTLTGLSNTVACPANLSSYVPSGNDAAHPQRIATTAWHPDWALEVRRAEAGKRTTSIYNGQPDPFNANATASCAPATALLPDGKPIAVLCKQVEQATTDLDGHLGFNAVLQAGVPNRQWSWNYNATGQVLKATDPLNHTTNYAYYTDTTADHTVGDLLSVTNALSKVTRFTRYNKTGQALQTIDANSVITDYTYDERQRLKSVTTDSKTTSYDYWPTGLLKQVTLADHSYLYYSYDDAHRLTGIQDSNGNSITYTLDNAGNRIHEEVKDQSGNLKRQIGRAFDPLGRVLQTTGARP
jgi:YD repeat-containing protein